MDFKTFKGCEAQGYGSSYHSLRMQRYPCFPLLLLLVSGQREIFFALLPRTSVCNQVSGLLESAVLRIKILWTLGIEVFACFSTSHLSAIVVKPACLILG